MNRKSDIVPDEPTDIPSVSNEKSPEKEISVYERGKSSNIDFEFADGLRQFFRYSHLLYGELHKIEGQEEIKLLYSTHTVVIGGYCLKDIYEGILADNVICIRENDERYINLVRDGAPFVTKINVLWRKEDVEKEPKA